MIFHYILYVTTQLTCVICTVCLSPTLLYCVSLSGGRLTVTSSHSPGSQFPVGETLVQYTATDAAGNSRTCNLTITVQGIELTAPFSLAFIESCCINSVFCVICVNILLYFYSVCLNCVSPIYCVLLQLYSVVIQH